MTKNTKSNKNTKKQAHIKSSHFSLSRIVIFLVVCLVTLGIGFGFKTPIENLLNKTSASTDVVIDQNGLNVYFIDVGQGDSIAIRFPDQKTMLVDAGPASSSTKLVSYLKSNFFKDNDCTFDYLLLTHSDEDHSGGMVSICDNFDVKKIYRPKIYSVYGSLDETNGDSTDKFVCKTKVYYNTIMSFKNETTDVVFTDLSTANTTQKISGTDYSIDFYAPTEDYYTEVNDFSPIMVLNYNSKKIMLTGDATTSSEAKVLATENLPDVDLLKVGHHGSTTSTSENFLQKIKPEYAIISVAEKNTYNLPKEQIINRLNNCGAKVYRTDQNGTIVANVTSGVSNLNILLEQNGTTTYIHIEYIIAGIIVLSASFCFGTKVAKKSSKSHK